MSPRYGKFEGGIDLRSEKEATLDSPIAAPAGRLNALRVSLAPCGGRAAEPLVTPGTRVLSGRRIASGPGDGVDIFAPLDGTVASIIDSVTNTGSRLVASPAIELTDLSQARPLPHTEVKYDWENEPAEEFHARIAEGQLVTSHRACRPLIEWLMWARNSNCRHLIVNGIEDQPFVTANHRLLVEHGQEVVGGLAILSRAAEVHSDNVILAVDQEYTARYPELTNPTSDYSIKLIALERKYPVGSDNILLKVLTRQEVPCGGTPADIGAAIIDPATCFAVYRWVACGQRLTGRVVTIGGDRHPAPSYLFVPYGADCGLLAHPADPPLVLGGPMTGVECADRAVVGPCTDAVLALAQTPHHISTQCIRCGWCRDHCPARLNVAVLNDLFELGQFEDAEHLGVQSCVGCGICSYVCPGRLPLSERMGELASSLARMRESMPLFSPRFDHDEQ